MRTIDKSPRVGRRNFLRGGAAAVPAAALAASGLALPPHAAWAQAAQSLKPRSMATLVLMARDIYPHDQIPDRFYINAVIPYDKLAGQDGAVREMLESGVAGLDRDALDRYRLAYLEVPSETDRVALLEGMKYSKFFNKLRSDLVVSFYNQHELWLRFGYEGSSADHGGYIHRGFNDIDWLPQS
jgi:hypothetical protein